MLNQDQQAGVTEFMNYLQDKKRKYFHIKGPAGVGKTFLMRYMHEEALKQYDKVCELLGLERNVVSVQFTATTNKAADVLSKAIGQETSTIHSFLGLRVFDDYKTGETKIGTTNNTKAVPAKTLLFIDESPMIDSLLYKFIDTLTEGCKVVFVGDQNQLSPVGERISPIYMDAMVPQAVLRTPVRNADHPELMNLCNQFRISVEQDLFKAIQECPGVIDVVDHQYLGDAMKHLFSEGRSSKVLAFTNDRVQEYNRYCLEMQGYEPDMITSGQALILNSAIAVGKTLVPTESEILVGSVDSNKTNFYGVMVYRIMIDGNWVMVPVSHDELSRQKKAYAKSKQWTEYFALKNEVADLRPTYAGTVHKSQGSTYDEVLVDLEDIGACRGDTNMVARLLYVAVSRARHRVLLYGNLPSVYGGAVRRA